MNGPLCDALTGQEDGRAVLEGLDRDNLFLVPLDDRRQWYRYHHLFADVLKARLLDGQPERIGELHRLASGWYEENGDRSEAVRHALSGGDFEAAATPDGAGDACPAEGQARGDDALWLETLPDDVLRVRPVLSNALAGALMSTGTFEGVEDLLSDAEQWLDPEATGGVVVDQDEFGRLPAELAVHRAGLALLRGDVDGTFTFARRALELVHADDDPLAHGAASALQGLAAWSTGDLALADTSYAASLVDFERIDHISDVLGCSFTLADIQVAQGSLRTAMRTYDEAMALASRHGNRALRGQVGMHVGRAALHREFNDLAAARSELTRSRELGEHAGLPQNAYRWRVVMAQVCEAEGDLESATSLLDEAERLYDADFSPDVRPIPALRARAWIRQGRLDEAMAWMARRGLSVTDELSYLREFEHLTLARLLVAERAPGGDEQALELARRPAASGPGRATYRLGDRDQGGGSAGTPESWRHGLRTGVPRGRVEPGGAGRLRPHVRGRGCTHGGTAGRSGCPRQSLPLRPQTPGLFGRGVRASGPGGCQPDDRAAEQPRTRRTATAGNRAQRPRDRS